MNETEAGNVPGKLFDTRELEVGQRHEAKRGPEEGLGGLEEVGEPPPDEASVALVLEICRYKRLLDISPKIS